MRTAGVALGLLKLRSLGGDTAMPGGLMARLCHAYFSISLRCKWSMRKRRFLERCCASYCISQPVKVSTSISGTSRVLLMTTRRDPASSPSLSASPSLSLSFSAPPAAAASLSAVGSVHDGTSTATIDVEGSLRSSSAGAASSSPMSAQSLKT